MSMSRKHFKVIASVIQKADLTGEQRIKLADDMAREIKQISGNFDRCRFIEACTKGAS